MSNSNAVIERMARAMWDQDHSEGLGDEGWAEAEHDTKASYLGSAQTALAALKAGDELGGGLVASKPQGWDVSQIEAAEAMREAGQEIAAAIRKLKLPAKQTDG